VKNNSSSNQAQKPDFKLNKIYLGLSVALMAAQTVSAQEQSAYSAQNNVLEEIVVSAQKRTEGLQEAPIAITAVTRDAIDRQGLNDLQQVAEVAPNVTFDFTAPISGASNAATIYVRGIGQSDFALTTEAGVGTYIDGVYSSRSLGGVLDVLDIERVEVLRGPQGTLFGRNTIGGAISITTQRPDQEQGGTVEVSVGDFSRRFLRGSLNLPLSDSTALRVSVSSKDQDGFVNAAIGVDQRDLPPSQRDSSLQGLNNLGNQNRQAARVVLEHEFSPSFIATIATDVSRARENNAADRLVGITDTLADGPLAFIYNNFQAPSTTLPGFPDSLYSAANFITNDDTTFSTGPNGSNIDSFGTALTLEYDISDNFTIKSISAYRDTDGFFNRDADGSPLRITHTSNFDYQHKQFSQEFQFIGASADNKLRYAAGLYYFDETGSDPLRVEFPEVFGTLFIDTADIDNTSIAAFAQVNYDINDRLQLTVGGRYTRDEKEFLTDQIILTGSASPALFNGAPEGTEIPLIPRNSFIEETFTDFSPRVSLDYQLDSSLIYGSFSQGFKSGGFNLRYVQPRDAILPFDPEEADSFELGYKWESSDRRLRFNAAAFYTDYTDIQVTVFENLGAPITLNSGDAEIKGLEFELNALLFEGLELNVSTGFLDAEYTEIRSNPANISTPEQAITTDTELPNSPEWQATIGAAYTTYLTNSSSLEFRGDWRLSGDVENDAQNSRFLSQDAYDVLNLSTTYRPPSEAWSLRLFVDNVTDERFIVSGDSNFGIGFHEANFNRPRQWGITFKTSF